MTLTALPVTARITPMKLHPRVLLHVKRGRWYWPPGCPSCTINSSKTSLRTYFTTHRNCDNARMADPPARSRVPRMQDWRYADYRARRRRRRRSLPARPGRGRPRRQDHRHRQHRRRHHPVRPARLPGPGHGDVHARRRHQPRAGLGARGRDVQRRRGARRLRRRAVLVHARRPRLRDPHPAQPAARVRPAALRRHPGALRALAAGGRAHPDVRRQDRNPRQDQHR